MSLRQRFSRFFRAAHPERDRLRPLETLLGYSFTNIDLLLLGLTHRSAIRNGDQVLSCNERLEFLGDSVLGAVIAEQLYRDQPDKSEGHLTRVKSLLVNETTLSTIGRQIGLNHYIRLSADEERTGGRERASIVSDAFEGVIGAIYLDGGFLQARRVILQTVYARRDQFINDSSQRNYKGELLELAQANGGSAPRYDVIAQEGPDHERTFHVEVSINGRVAGEGSGSSKKEAEQRAAAMALLGLQLQLDQSS